MPATAKVHIWELTGGDYVHPCYKIHKMKYTAYRIFRFKDDASLLM